jgi:hypothetical protein
MGSPHINSFQNWVNGDVIKRIGCQLNALLKKMIVSRHSTASCGQDFFARELRREKRGLAHNAPTSRSELE